MNYNLKLIRQNNNYTSNQIAKELNISKSFYSQLENGKRKLSYDMALKISNIFKLKPDDIFYEDHKNNIK